MPSDIFISYSHKDKATVAALARLLETEWVVWWDSDLYFGETYEKTIFQKIRSVPVKLIVVSRYSRLSTWVKRETQTALDSGLVIPILIEDVELPEELSHLHYCNLIGWNGTDDSDALKQLRRDVRLANPAPGKYLVESREVKSDTTAEASPTKSAALHGDGQFAAKTIPLQGKDTFIRYILIVVVALFVAEIIYAFTFLQSAPNGSTIKSEMKSAPIDPTIDSEFSPLASKIPMFLASDQQAARLPEWIEMLHQGRFAEVRQILEARTQKIPESATGDLAHPDDISGREAVARAAEPLFPPPSQGTIPDTSELIHLARMYEFGLGGAPDRKEAARLLGKAASLGRNDAKFDLGIKLIFGRGVPSDVYSGSRLIKDALDGGFEPDQASQIFQPDCCHAGLEGFSDIQKRLELLAKQGDRIAQLFNVVTLAHGISAEPCLLQDCLSQARKLAEEMRSDKQDELSDIAWRVMKSHDIELQDKPLDWMNDVDEQHDRFRYEPPNDYKRPVVRARERSWRWWRIPRL